MFFVPPALQTPEARRPQPIPLAQAEDLALIAFDEGKALPRPALAAGDKAAYAWLAANATAAPKTPANPFKAGDAAHGEAAAWRAFLAAPPAEWAARLPQLSLSLTGTQLGLWRWGRVQTRLGHLDKAGRVAFEDRLAASPVPYLRSYGLRHALCYAVAEADEARFRELRDRYQLVEEDLFPPFQRLFALLGGPAPVFRFFALPGLDFRDLNLAELGGTRIWMQPAQGRLDPLPADVAWIIPSGAGSQAPGDARLDEDNQLPARQLAERLQAAGRHAWYAASRIPFERYGLFHFPILIELDGEKRITRIRMGDAAPEHP